MRGLNLSASTRRLGGPTIGYVWVGVSAFAFLASGPRLLGPDEYSDLAVAWMLAMIFSSGLAVPGELTVNAAVGQGFPRLAHGHVRTVLIVAATPAVACFALSLGGRSVLGVSEPVWWASVVLAVYAYALSAGVRGRIGGEEGYAAYGTVLAVEGACRLALLLAAWMLRGDTEAAAWLLALAIGGPVALSGVVATLWLRRRPGSSDSEASGRPAAIFAPITSIAISMQIVLGTAPLWLNSRPEIDPALAGLFVSVASYMRTPLLLTSGTTIVVLSRSSRAVASRDVTELKATLRHGLVLVGLLTSGLSVGLVALSPLGLRILYGPSIGTQVSVSVLVVMAASTILVALGTVANQSLVACHRQREAAGAWMLAALITTVLLSIGATSLMGASAAVLAGVAFASAATIAAIPWAIRGVQGEPSYR